MHNYQGANDKETQRAKLPRLLEPACQPGATAVWGAGVGTRGGRPLQELPLMSPNLLMGGEQKIQQLSWCLPWAPSSKQPLHLPGCYMSGDDAEIPWEPEGGISGLEDALGKNSTWDSCSEAAKGREEAVVGKQQL